MNIPPGALVLMCGPPCSGKTTTATLVAEERGAVRLSPDQWVAAIGLDLKTPLRDNVDALQWTVAQQIVRSGASVVIESGHWMRAERDEKRLWARASAPGWNCGTSTSRSRCWWSELVAEPPRPGPRTTR